MAADEPPAKQRRRYSRKVFIVALGGALLAGAGAYAASNWVVGLGAGSSGEAQSGSVSNLTITASASPSASNVLYPGQTGDVVALISNPNPFPVTITAVQLPADTAYAAGFSDSALSIPQTGCSNTQSLVSWNYATSSADSSHTLTTPLTVAAASGAPGTLTVTFTNDASMDNLAPVACASTYFAMPSLAGVTATGGAAVATTSPATDNWTS
jgi:hypothetical protein